MDAMPWVQNKILDGNRNALKHPALAFAEAFVGPRRIGARRSAVSTTKALSAPADCMASMCASVSSCADTSRAPSLSRASAS